MGTKLHYNAEAVADCLKSLRSMEDSIESIANNLKQVKTSESWWPTVRIQGYAALSSGIRLSYSDASSGVLQIRKCTDACREKTDQIISALFSTSMQIENAEAYLSGGFIADGSISQLVDYYTVTGELSPEEIAAREREQREKETGWIKWAVGGLCIVGGIAATVLTGGAFAAVVAAGAVSGFAMGFTNTAVDTYIATGDTDWQKAFQDGAVQGVIGGVTSACSFGLTRGMSYISQLQKWTHSASTVARVMTYAGIGATSSTVSGVAGRTAGGVFSGVAFDDWNRMNEVLDGKRVLVDAAMGGALNSVRGFSRPNPPIRQGIPTTEDGKVIWGPDRTGETTEVIIKKGETVIRRGTPNGTYFAPDGTSFRESALPYEYGQYEYHKYIVTQDIHAESSVVARQPQFEVDGIVNGGGIQYQVPGADMESLSVQTLLERGYLIEDFSMGFSHQHVDLGRDGQNK